MAEVLLLFVLFIVFCQCSDKADWESFKKQYDKHYSNGTEELNAMKTFFLNRQLIGRHNEEFIKGRRKYYLRMNNFGDMVKEIFEQKLAKYNVSRREWDDAPTRFGKKEEREPERRDWRERSAVSRVKTQGLCGSGWAFSASGSLEGQWSLRTGRLVRLSEQNLVDCTAGYGNAGCSGGDALNAYQYVLDNGGLAEEDSYPYEGSVGRCRFMKARSGAAAQGYALVPQDEGTLKNAVAFVGPISAAMHALGHRFQFYGGGVFADKRCTPSGINHGILVVGYGVENGTDYWLLKNSMGVHWGEGGFMKLERNRDNHCGIASILCYPLV